MEGRDARIARDRMLGALEGCTDQKSGQTLWRAMAKYNGRLRSELSGSIQLEKDRAAHAHHRGSW